METRDCLNYLGQKVGELQMPEGTSEEIWAKKLAPFAQPPDDQMTILTESLLRSVEQQRQIAVDVIEKFKKNNLLRFANSGVSLELAVMQSMWVHHRLRALEVTFGGVSMTIDLLNLCMSGDLETAEVVLQLMTPDDMTQPYHFLSQEVIDELYELIEEANG